MVNDRADAKIVLFLDDTNGEYAGSLPNQGPDEIRVSYAKRHKVRGDAMIFPTTGAIVTLWDGPLKSMVQGYEMVFPNTTLEQVVVVRKRGKEYFNVLAELEGTHLWTKDTKSPKFI